ncbi:MAG: two-component sensor histidine kinase [Bacteroidetes bacterium HGW-Bacteroidetes-1]|jgi:signal transduction histidine kinase|nr:MAG: two-component sensor histidine kinase [Bacteroidetes bacterium HGW-Bacteroidetes-1]
MKPSIRTRLTFQFTYIVVIILVLFSSSIYYFSASYRESEFFSRLEDKASNTAGLLIEVKEVDHDLLKIIDRNTINAMFNEKVIIYDYQDKEIYNSLDDDSIQVSKKLLDKIRLEKNIRYHEGEHEVVGLLYTDKYDRFVVIASALDKYGKSKLINLKWILIIGFFISIALTVYFGRIYAYRALKPMSDVVKEVDKITISSLDMRVNEGNGTDEIAQLAITFNKMLERLESAFEMQRSFVSNASHELRTPLTSITGQIEVSLMKQRSLFEYESLLNSLLEDVKNLNDLSNGLLDMAKASSDISEISFQKMRVDELLWETREELIGQKKDYNVIIQFIVPIDDENKLAIVANKRLLKIAFANLMDNACKYSENKKVEVLLMNNENFIVAEFIDNGIGIDKEDLDKIFQPFFRAKNVRNISGNGLGLSLTEKIIGLHQGKISAKSELNIGTSISISIPFIS